VSHSANLNGTAKGSHHRCSGYGSASWNTTNTLTPAHFRTLSTRRSIKRLQPAALRSDSNPRWYQLGCARGQARRCTECSKVGYSSHPAKERQIDRTTRLKHARVLAHYMGTGSHSCEAKAALLQTTFRPSSQQLHPHETTFRLPSVCTYMKSLSRKPRSPANPLQSSAPSGALHPVSCVGEERDHVKCSATN
jgi:hypothetical protein